MMIAHPQMENVLELSQNQVSALVVENPGFFRKLLLDFYHQLQGQPGELILSDKDVILPICKWVELIDNCLNFELNRKALLNRICSTLEQRAVSEEFFFKTAELLSHLESYMDELAFSLPCDIRCEKCSVSGIIKSVGIHLRDEYDDPLERLLDYMELVREFDRDKLFVLVGMRSFFADREMEMFLKTVLSHGFRVLLLDSVDRERIRYERRLTIDRDLCEF